MISTSRVATTTSVLMWFDGNARERLSLLPGLEAEAIFHELIGNPAVGMVRLAALNPGACIVAPAYGPPRPETGLGHVAQEILRQAECPVLIVQPRMAWTSWKLDRILVPQDGTAEAAQALSPATRLAERSGAEVLILHVSPDCGSGLPEPGAMECPAYVDQPQHEWSSWVTAFLGRVRHLCRMTPRTPLRFQWACGDPGREILSLARRKRVDLITMCWTRRAEPGQARVVRQVLRECPCPILILPGATS